MTCLEETKLYPSGFGSKCELCAAEHKQFPPLPRVTFWVNGQKLMEVCKAHAKDVRKMWDEAHDPVEESIAA